MLSAYRVEQIRAAEESAARVHGWDGLMQAAAAALADVVALRVPSDATTLVLVGPGNNGGDALFAAARLSDRGHRVDIALLDQAKAHEAGLAAARHAGARFVEAPSDQRYVVDGLFGIGARPGLEGRAAQWADWVRDERPYVIAVDTPSGIGVDDGTVPGTAVAADVTVTFGGAKPGLLIGRGALASGELVVCGVGIAEHLSDPACEALELGDGARFAHLVPGPESHKYSRGVVGIEAGSPEYAGAAHLCVAGAQAGTAGMVRFVGQRELCDRVVDRAPEVVAGRGHVQAWVVGPGGIDDPEPVRAALDDDVPVLLDATALTHLPPRLRPDVLLTPHAGELARMLEVERAEVEADPWPHARTAARRWDATVLLKGPRTLVVAPDGRTMVNTSGTPWLATAGAGDMLAGFAGSLLSSGLGALSAGALAALLHGAAAERAALAGPFPAHHIAELLPSVLGDFLVPTAAR
ncbi:NAD(P)H-hydrate epimerase [Aeromicrobium sp. YIM 150415]|uniref:NAD(P)H-hydrate epimerase n=1 Tax=Aeromicrobium sp. YIM 150415 TaxID=2803912 RepID=UPI0019652DD1|nr:NAD(P)H-hydrate epimerase [Aeromicrobium sp. YIM 150415]MBM9462036.1 NAD(P)H-hydrate epimerase [Aeromicrobium sp. YIM 150415]